MVARTHNLFAFACLITIAVNYGSVELTTPTIITSLIANSVGSMMPDIDQASNKIWDMLPLGDALGKIMSNLFGPHRTLSHSLIGMFLINKLVYYLLPNLLNVTHINSQVVATSFMIGYSSHLLADSLTEEGLPLLFPIKKKFGFPPIKSWRIKTGKWFENFVINPVLVVYLVFTVFSNYKFFLKYFGLNN